MVEVVLDQYYSNLWDDFENSWQMEWVWVYNKQGEVNRCFTDNFISKARDNVKNAYHLIDFHQKHSWLLAEKGFKEEVCGTIIESVYWTWYCTGSAGLLRTCNHVAGLLSSRKNSFT